MLKKVLQNYAWFPITVITIHLIAVSLKIYDIFPDFDIPMHLFGGISIAYFLGGVYIVAQDSNLLGKPVWFLYPIIVFALTSTVTILWEFLEFAGHYIGIKAQLGLGDTMLDMFMGMLGAFLFLSFQILCKKVKM